MILLGQMMIKPFSNIGRKENLVKMALLDCSQPNNPIITLSHSQRNVPWIWTPNDTHGISDRKLE
jgi:hypothetical protein